MPETLVFNAAIDMTTGVPTGRICRNCASYAGTCNCRAGTVRAQLKDDDEPTSNGWSDQARAASVAARRAASLAKGTAHQKEANVALEKTREAGREGTEKAHAEAAAYHAGRESFHRTLSAGAESQGNTALANKHAELASSHQAAQISHEMQVTHMKAAVHNSDAIPLVAPTINYQNPAEFDGTSGPSPALLKKLGKEGYLNNAQLNPPYSGESGNYVGGGNPPYHPEHRTEAGGQRSQGDPLNDGRRGGPATGAGKKDDHSFDQLTGGSVTGSRTQDDESIDAQHFGSWFDELPADVQEMIRRAKADDDLRRANRRRQGLDDPDDNMAGFYSGVDDDFGNTSTRAVSNAGVVTNGSPPETDWLDVIEAREEAGGSKFTRYIQNQRHIIANSSPLSTYTEPAAVHNQAPQAPLSRAVAHYMGAAVANSDLGADGLGGGVPVTNTSSEHTVAPTINYKNPDEFPAGYGPSPHLLKKLGRM